MSGRKTTITSLKDSGMRYYYCEYFAKPGHLCKNFSKFLVVSDTHKSGKVICNVHLKLHYPEQAKELIKSK